MGPTHLLWQLKDLEMVILSMNMCSSNSAYSYSQTLNERHKLMNEI